MHFFLMLQRLKLTAKIGKQRKIKFGRIDSTRVLIIKQKFDCFFSYLVLFGRIALGTDQDPDDSGVTVTSSRVKRSVTVL